MQFYDEKQDSFWQTVTLSVNVRIAAMNGLTEISVKPVVRA